MDSIINIDNQRNVNPFPGLSWYKSAYKHTRRRAYINALLRQLADYQFAPLDHGKDVVPPFRKRPDYLS